MQEQILQPAEDVWHRQSVDLEEALTQTIRELNNVVRLNDYHRHGHDPQHLERVLGPFAASSLDLGSLSRVLGENARSRAMSAGRLERVQESLATLGEMKDACASTTPGCTFIDIEEDEKKIHELAEDHLNRMARVFRALRIAQLEVRAKYEAETHDAVFAEFNWRQLGPAELRLCPPFIVIANLDGDNGNGLRKMMSLLESRKPIKLAALRSSLRKVYSTTSDTSVPASMAVETVPLAMRGVYFLQTCVAAPHFRKRLFEGLSAPRPGIISLLCPMEGETVTAFEQRAARAMRARAFPLCAYDPDLARGFVSCFDLSANPAPEALWSIDQLSGSDTQGQQVQIEEAFSFAHYAATEPEFANEFSDPPEGADNLVPLIASLDFTRRQRVGKLPYVSLPGENGSIVRKVVSPLVVLQSSDRLHLWRTLQEISGIDNPHVNATRTTLRNEQQTYLEELQHEMEQTASHRERVAVGHAVRKLVSHFTGVDAAQIDIEGIPPHEP